MQRLPDMKTREMLIETRDREGGRGEMEEGRGKMLGEAKSAFGGDDVERREIRLWRRGC